MRSRKFLMVALSARDPETIEWTAEMAVKQGYPHFMIKEIHEQPETLRNTLRMQDHYLDLLTTFLDRANEVFLVACGTSYHACLAASYMFSKLAFLPTYPVYASEFIEQHGKSVNIDSTILAVSQSGETADTIAAVTCAQQRAATILSLTNVIGSTLTRFPAFISVRRQVQRLALQLRKLSRPSFRCWHNLPLGWQRREVKFLRMK